MRHLSFPTPKSLSLTFVISSRMEYWFCFTIWLIQGRKGEFQRLPLFLLNYSSYYPGSQGTNVGVKPTPSMFITIVYSGSGERTTRWFSEPSGLTVSQTQARIPFFTWPQYASTQTGVPWSCFLTLRMINVIIQENNYKTHWRKTGTNITTYNCVVAGVFLDRTQLFFNQWVWKRTQVQKMDKGLWLLIMAAAPVHPLFFWL